MSGKERIEHLYFIMLQTKLTEFSSADNFYPLHDRRMVQIWIVSLKIDVTFKLLLKLTLILLTTFCSAFHPPIHLCTNSLHNKQFINYLNTLILTQWIMHISGFSPSLYINQRNQSLVVPLSIDFHVNVHQIQT